MVECQYDAFGRRITQQTIQGGHTTTTDYYYDGEDIILQIKDDGTTSTTTQYVHGPGIDEPLAMIQDGTPYFYHADGLGSIVALTDSNKQIVQRYGYDTFGMLTSVQNPEFNNSYTYTAREWDRELGLYYYRARYYDPMEGRFISKDPIGFAGGDVNLYRYVQNDPVNLSDPTGLETYQCKKPLNALGGSGFRSGPDVMGNPLYHQYSCIIDLQGRVTCGGQDRAGSSFGSPGAPSDDKYNSNQCEKVQDDNQCFEKCMIDEWAKSRPWYGIPFGTDCQEYDDSVHKRCRKKCGL